MDSSIIALKTLVTGLVFGLAVAIPCSAQEPSALTFQAWKEVQILEAQNQVLRASMKLKEIKSQRQTASPEVTDPATDLPSGRVKKTAESDLLSGAEKDLKRVQDSLAEANALTFSQYVNVYLMGSEMNSETTAKLIEKLSKEELISLAKELLQRSSKLDNSLRHKDARWVPTKTQHKDFP